VLVKRCVCVCVMNVFICSSFLNQKLSRENDVSSGAKLTCRACCKFLFLSSFDEEEDETEEEGADGNELTRGAVL